MRNVSLCLLPVVLLSLVTANGEEVRVVSPPGYENVEGPGQQDGTADINGFRANQVFLASDFAVLPDTHHVLTGFRFRPDGTLQTTFSRTWDHLLMRLSITDRTVDTLDLTFDNNPRLNETTVYDGPITWATDNTGPTNGPKDFGDYGVDFQIPFNYDPNLGNLMIDWYIPQPFGDINYDVVPNVVSGGSVWTDSPNSPTATDRGRGAPVTQFIFIPEPASLVLVLAGLLGLLVLRRR